MSEWDGGIIVNSEQTSPACVADEELERPGVCPHCGEAIVVYADVTGLLPDEVIGERRATHSWLVCQLHAELRAFRAPVDVETVAFVIATAATEALLARPVWPELSAQERERVLAAVRLHVERAARLAREAEGLRADVAALKQERDERHAEARACGDALDAAGELHRGEPYAEGVRRVLSDLATARAELAKVVLERDAMAERTAEIDRLKDRPGKVFSEVIMRKDGQRYIGGWYDHSGQEYAHVTEAWLATRLFEQTGYEWTVRISGHGNGHYSAVATSGG